MLMLTRKDRLIVGGLFLVLLVPLLVHIIEGSFVMHEIVIITIVGLLIMFYTDWRRHRSR